MHWLKGAATGTESFGAGRAAEDAEPSSRRSSVTSAAQAELTSLERRVRRLEEKAKEPQPAVGPVATPQEPLESF